MSNAELIERLNIKAGVMENGERIAWGSDTALMREAADALELADKRITELEAELERERMRLVACGVVAMADTPDNAKEARKMHPDYESAACSDVARRVDECIELRSKLSVARWALRDIRNYATSEAYMSVIDAAGTAIVQIGGEDGN